MNSSQGVTLRELGRMLRRRLPVLALVFVLVLAGGVALAASRPKRYQATAKVVLTPVLGKNLTFIPAQESLQALINAYAETARSAATVAATRLQLGRPLGGTVSSFTQAGDDSITLAVTATTPLLAREDTQALLGVFESSMRGNTFFTVSLITPPALPTQTVPPRPPLIIAVAGALGLILGFIVALFIDYIRREPPLSPPPEPPPPPESLAETLALR
jgi:capsular polysaccharide biosynthesis protein